MLRLRSVLGAVIALLMAAVFTTSIASACNKNFVVYNKSDDTITKFYVSPHSADNWEDNVLSDDIEPDMHTRVDMSEDTREVSMYDVKAVFDGGGMVTGGNINLCRARSVYIYNDRVTFSD